MRLYQLGESEAKKNQPKSKTLFGCRENNRKTQGRKRAERNVRYEKEREQERERESLFGNIYLLNVLNSLSLK